jgi:hypothetical protein
MEIKELLSSIKGIFKPPKKKYYIGKIAFGCPYFYPTYFNKNIISIRKLKLTSEDKYQEIIKDSPWLKDKERFTNLPMCRRSKDWIVKVFNNWYWIEVGWPISVKTIGLGWKDKYDSPRAEWSPSFQIYFFHLQFCIWWNAPDDNNDQYYEQVLWYLKYSNKDIVKAKKTWPWTNNKKSTWNYDYLINKQNGLVNS